jgi:cytochrome c553
MRIKKLLRQPLVALLLPAAVLLAPAGAAAAGDPEAGKAQSTTCAACHGQDGAQGLDGTYPPLAGQNEAYLFKQLKMIQDNERVIALMTGQLNGKSDQDLADLAAYYASLPPRRDQAKGDDTAISAAQQIYRGGIADQGVAACSACHGPNGAGNTPAGFPRIGGMPAPYTIAQLTAYREGERATDEGFGGMMRGVARGLTDGQIELLADYLQGLN